jgi:hypothetical protein
LQNEGEAVSAESRQQHAENRAIEVIVKLAHSKNVRAMQELIETAKNSIDGYQIDPKTAKLVHGQSGDVRRFVARSTSRGRSWLSFLRKIDGSGWWVTAYKTRKAAEERK